MIIDVHSHIWPEKISLRAAEFLASAFKLPVSIDPTYDNLLRRMDETGVDISIISSVATRPDQVKPINNWLSTIKNGRLPILGAMHPFYDGWEDELKRVRESFVGVKMQPEFQDFYIDDEAVFPLYERIEEYGLPLLVHSGTELTGTGKIHCSPERLVRIMAKFPRIKIIAAHMGGYALWADVLKLLAGKSIWFDTSFAFGHADDALLKEIIAAHPEGNILFGSDFPLGHQGDTLSRLRDSGITPALLEKILGANAIALFGLKE